MWPRAKHLHTSAECTLSPFASLSSPELLSDLFTRSPNAAIRQNEKKKDKGRENGGKETEGGRGQVMRGQVTRDTGEGERKEAMRERERERERGSVGEMITRRRWRGAGGETHSVVVYRLTGANEGAGERRKRR